MSAGALVAAACRALDEGRIQEGEALALRACEAASGDSREHVLALLALARVPGRADDAVREAARVADASDDANLVTAVARAAKAAGVALPVHVF